MLLARVATDDALVLVAASDDEGRLLGATVFRTKEQWLAHIVTAFLESDGDAALAARVIGAPPLTGLSQGVMQALTFMDDDIASGSVSRY